MGFWEVYILPKTLPKHWESHPSLSWSSEGKPGRIWAQNSQNQPDFEMSDARSSLGCKEYPWKWCFGRFLYFPKNYQNTGRRTRIYRRFLKQIPNKSGSPNLENPRDCELLAHRSSLGWKEYPCFWRFIYFPILYITVYCMRKMSFPSQYKFNP